MSCTPHRFLFSAAAIAALFTGRLAASVSAAAPQSTAGAARATDGTVQATEGTVPTERTAEAWTRLCDDAVGDDAGRAQEAVTELRASGFRGLQQFRGRHLAAITRLAERPACVCDPDSQERRVAAALDRISAQRDAASSGLYWYTDFDAAVAEARRYGRPILSLRMLGRLDDDLSCANSRFFRTTLYSDSELAEYLGNHFVLHWESVRPVPVITIDFGDGRTMRRTITGNSIHYVLDADGRVIDGIPGLYSPAEFRARLEAAEGYARTSQSVRRERGLAIDLRRYHHAGMLRIDEAVREARRSIAAVPAAPDTDVPIANGLPTEPAAPLSNSLGATLVGPRSVPEPFQSWALPTQAWSQLNGTAGLPEPSVRLDLAVAMRSQTIRPASPVMVARSMPDAHQALVTTSGKFVVERSLVAQVVRPPIPLLPTGGHPLVAIDRPIEPEVEGTPTAGEFRSAAAAAGVLDPLSAALPKVATSVMSQSAQGRFPPAVRATAITRTKGFVEAAVVAELDDRKAPLEPDPDSLATAATLRRLAEPIRGATRLAPGSLARIRAKFDSTPAAKNEKPSFDELLEALQTSIAADTAMNEYTFHRKIHAWLAADPNIDVYSLNERVYAELFLTPRQDPWLGLAPPAAFPALDHGGLFIEP